MLPISLSLSLSLSLSIRISFGIVIIYSIQLTNHYSESGIQTRSREQIDSSLDFTNWKV